MGNNMERLGRSIAKRTARAIDAARTTPLELGTIEGNLALKLDGLGDRIPQGDYMLALSLTGAFETEPATCTVAHSHKLPQEFRAPRAGDRVLVAWCDNEPIIIAIVVAS
ncbi:MAG: hypothetical protein Q4C56_04095 [Peptococcaceae bacterium]|nr:hypothetical protein [Peptococcaceae bacterium]